MKKVDVVKVERNIKIIGFIISIIPLLLMYVYAWYVINNPAITFKEARDVVYLLFNVGFVSIVIGGIVLPLIGYFYIVYKNKIYCMKK